MLLNCDRDLQAFIELNKFQICLDELRFISLLEKRVPFPLALKLFAFAFGIPDQVTN